tara:strand:- start:51354 stop:51527 length:174 start_codon:yes stop_codon:yes gene_type:complete
MLPVTMLEEVGETKSGESVFRGPALWSNYIPYTSTTLQVRAQSQATMIHLMMDDRLL